MTTWINTPIRELLYGPNKVKPTGTRYGPSVMPGFLYPDGSPYQRGQVATQAHQQPELIPGYPTGVEGGEQLTNEELLTNSQVPSTLDPSVLASMNPQGTQDIYGPGGPGGAGGAGVGGVEENTAIQQQLEASGISPLSAVQPQEQRSGFWQSLSKALGNPEMARTFLDIGTGLGAGQSYGQAIGQAGNAMYDRRAVAQTAEGDAALQEAQAQAYRARAYKDYQDANAAPTVRPQSEGVAKRKERIAEADIILDQIGDSSRGLLAEAEVLSSSGYLSQITKGAGGLGVGLGLGGTKTSKFINKYNAWRAGVLRQMATGRGLALNQATVLDMLREPGPHTGGKEIKLYLQRFKDYVGNEKNSVEASLGEGGGLGASSEPSPESRYLMEE